ncbi:MAG: 2TM domain-containing protein [Archaeoglobaceae archaeon]
MISVEEFKKSWKEIEIEEAKKGFLAHLCVYAIVNTFLAIVNYLTSPDQLWFFWVPLAWGIGLAFHFVFSCDRFVISNWEGKVAKVEMRARKKKEQ